MNTTVLPKQEHPLGKFPAALITGIIITGLLWLVKGIELYFQLDLGVYGLFPRRPESLYGIFTMPFIHADLNHLLGNSSAIFVLMVLTKWMYHNIFWRTTLMILILNGLWTWLIARPSYHVGASGLIYGYAAFIFFAGIFSKNFKMLAISLLVVFLYGSLIWGVFPMEPHVSWEAHLTGFVAGLVTAFFYRDKLPQRKKFQWEELPEEEEENEDIFDGEWKLPEQENTDAEQKRID